jgi:hypothetical protein
MFMNKMVSKLSNRIIDQMGTLINHDYQWTSKYGKDIFVQKLGDYYNNISAKCLCFHPLCYIVNGH